MGTGSEYIYCIFVWLEDLELIVHSQQGIEHEHGIQILTCMGYSLTYHDAFTCLFGFGRSKPHTQSRKGYLGFFCRSALMACVEQRGRHAGVVRAWYQSWGWGVGAATQRLHRCSLQKEHGIWFNSSNSNEEQRQLLPSSSASKELLQSFKDLIQLKANQAP